MPETSYIDHEKDPMGGWVSVALLSFFGGIVFLLSLSLLWQVVSPTGRKSCSDFHSWTSAYEAYRQGAYYLDRDKDGVPCEDEKY